MSTPRLPLISDNRGAHHPRKTVDLIALGLATRDAPKPADQLHLLTPPTANLPSAAAGPFTARAPPPAPLEPSGPSAASRRRQNTNGGLGGSADSVALWPSSMSTKPTLLVHLERYLHNHLLDVNRAAEAGMGANDLCNLRIAAVLDCTKMFCRTFRVYNEVFEVFDVLVSQVAQSVEKLQTQHSALEQQFVTVNGLVQSLTTQNFTMKHRFEAEMAAKDAHVAEVEKRFITDPQIAQQQLNQLRRLVEEGRRRIEQLTKRDDEISAALVGRSLALDDVEAKLFECEREKAGLEATIKRMEEERTHIMCRLELAALDAEREIGLRDAQLRQLEDELARARSILSEETAKRKQLQAVIGGGGGGGGNARRSVAFATRANGATSAAGGDGSGGALGEFAWEQVCTSREDPEMWRLDDEGNPTVFFLDMTPAARIEHLVGLWKASKVQRENDQKHATRHALSQFLFARPPSDSIIAFSAQRVEAHFVAISTQPSTTLELNLPKCLEWSSAVVVGSVLSASEVHTQIRDFLAFAANSLRENPHVTASRCFDLWMNNKHVLHHAKRVGAAYSLLHAVHSMDEATALTTHARLFLALVSGDVPFDTLLLVNRVIDDVAEMLERKQGSFSSITRTLLRTVLKKHFTWMAKDNVEEMLAVVERQFEIGYDQIAADVLCAPDGQFVEFLTMYTISSVAAHQRFVADCVAAINTGNAAAAGDEGALRSGCAPISTVFSMLQHCDPDKPYPKHEADCSFILGWNLESGDFSMDAPVNLHEFSSALRNRHAITRYTPKHVTSLRGVAQFPWRVTKITDETGAGVVNIYGSPDTRAEGGMGRRKSLAANKEQSLVGSMSTASASRRKLSKKSSS